MEDNKDRSSGRTTRQANQLIEDLFNGETIEIADHFEKGNNAPANDSLLRIILNRIFMEHRIPVEKLQIVKGKIPTIKLL